MAYAVSAGLRRAKRIAKRSLGLGGDGARGRRRLYFLHIGKNAGTQFRRIGDQINAVSDAHFVIKLPHSRKFASLPPDGDYAFSIRSPVSRFRSGFYSRRRKGMPRLHSEWTAHEALAFAEFEHANDLAEALFSEGARGRRAACAMNSISHCARTQTGWFERSGHFLELRPPLAIIRQERFAEDVRELIRRLGLDMEPDISRDPRQAHRNDYSQVPDLSPKAVANLTRWYAPDFEFLRICEDWIRSLRPGRGAEAQGARRMAAPG